MTEFRAQINMRINNDLNISLSLVDIVEGVGQAKLAGIDTADMVQAWTDGYATRVSEIAEERNSES
jgi:hypothetical protein